MIIARILGGLGNQIFQYAAGRRLSYTLHTSLKLDISEFKNYKLRTFKLNYFNIQATIASKTEIEDIKRNKILPFLYSKKYIREKEFLFDKKILHLQNNCYLEGYWQSELYFKDINLLLKEELNLKSKYINIRMKKIIGKINNNSVAIHIRRGDYATNNITRSIHGLLSLKYYTASLKVIKKYIKNPILYIFTDDILWAKKNFKFPYEIYYIGDYNFEDYQELYIMKYFKYFILANSTFSWWGAWLSEKKDIVIAPKCWFADESLNIKDLIPKKWIQI